MSRKKDHRPSSCCILGVVSVDCENYKFEIKIFFDQDITEFSALYCQHPAELPQKSWTLNQTLSHMGTSHILGLPAFIILTRNSEFYNTTVE